MHEISILSVEQKKKPSSLWRFRPNEIEEVLIRNFEKISSEHHFGSRAFPCNGRKVFIIGDLSSDKVVQEKIKEVNSCKILDLGTGNGLFLYTLHKKFQIPWSQLLGVSARDYRGQPPQTATIPDTSYWIDNIETIDFSSCGKFDLVFASHCFNYLADPLGTLSRVFEGLSPNGCIYLDSIGVQRDDMKKLCQKLQEEGYQIQFVCHGQFILNECLILSRNHQAELLLPLEYAGSKGDKVNYRYVL